MMMSSLTLCRRHFTYRSNLVKQMIQMVQNIHRVHSFDTIPQRDGQLDGQTDGRTEMVYIQIALCVC